MYSGGSEEGGVNIVFKSLALCAQFFIELCEIAFFYEFKVLLAAPDKENVKTGSVRLKVDALIKPVKKHFTGKDNV